jgi:GxxExxY protein
MTRDELNAFGTEIIDSSIEVHKEFGPGLLESVYTFALRTELKLRGINSSIEYSVPLSYKGFPTGKNYIVDLLVENEIIVEVKAVEQLHPLHEAQIISYLKLTEKRLGYLINFNVTRLKNGLHRFVNKF